MSILLCTTMFVLNGVVLIGKAEIGHLPTILVAAFFGILTADFLSGLVHFNLFWERCVELDLMSK